MEIPHGFCQCGCGQETPVHRKTNRTYGSVKGERMDYIHGHNRRKYASDAEYKEYRKAYLRARYIAKKTEIAAKEAARYVAKKEEILNRNAAYRAEWAKTPKGKEVNKREIRRRKARRRDAFVEDLDRDLVFVRDDGQCGICGKLVDPKAWDLDHIIPLGPGTETYDNVRVTCQPCNRAKGAADKLLLAKWRLAQ